MDIVIVIPSVYCVVYAIITSTFPYVLESYVLAAGSTFLNVDRKLKVRNVTIMVLGYVANMAKIPYTCLSVLHVHCWYDRYVDVSLVCVVRIKVIKRSAYTWFYV